MSEGSPDRRGAAGWDVICVPPCGGAGPGSLRLGYAHTAGLRAGLRHPELAVASLDPVHSSGLLIAAAVRAAQGRPLDDGTEMTGPADFPLRARDVSRVRSPLAFAGPGRLAGERVPVRQLLIPDNAGRFPGGPGCDPLVAAVQQATVPAGCRC